MTNEIINRAASESHLDNAALTIQDYIGQDDGGVASVHFSGHEHTKDNNAVEWKEASLWQRETMIRNYLKAELSYHEVDEFVIEEREIPQKMFLQRDLSGRGYNGQVSALAILDSSFSGNMEELDDYVFGYEVGDRWENGYTEFTRIS